LNLSDLNNELPILLSVIIMLVNNQETQLIHVKKQTTIFYPRCTVKGCLFHYSQSLFRKLSIEGWKTQYLTNNLLQVWFKKRSLSCIDSSRQRIATILYIKK